VHRNQLELKLLDMLTDPVTQAVMDADHVDLRELIAMLSEIGMQSTARAVQALGSIERSFRLIRAATCDATGCPNIKMVDPGTVGSGSRAGLATQAPALATHCWYDL